VNISGRFALERGMEGRLGKNFMRRINEDGYIDVKNKKGLAFLYLINNTSFFFHVNLIMSLIQWTIP
jgi:hypothetical protein